MVLKKSNSRLNSGATQRRVTHTGIFRLGFYMGKNSDFYHSNVQNLLRLTTDINLRNEQAKESLYASCEKVHEYLAMGMGKISLATPDSRRRHPYLPIHLTEYSLHKQNMWLLPERIKQMMTDTDFLESMSPKIGLRIKEIRDNISSGVHTLKTKITSASDVVKKSSEPMTQTQNIKKSRTRNTYHGRGVQRPHLFKKIQKNIQTELPAHEEHNEEQMGHLDLNVYEPFHVESRSVFSHHLYKKFSHSSRSAKLKSSTKMNGRSKNKFPCRQAFCKLDVSRDGLYGPDEIFEDNFDTVIATDEEGTEMTRDSSNLQAIYDIHDFLKPPSAKVKRKKAKTKMYATTEHEDIPKYNKESTDQIRYPKGSYSVVPKEECRLNLDDTEMSFSQSICSHSGHNQEIHNHLFQQNKKNTIREDAHNEIRKHIKYLNAEKLQEFDSSFVQVNLVLSEDEKKWFSPWIEKTCTNRQIDNEYSVSTGMSFPQCFIVDFSPDKQMHENSNIWRVLVGRKNETADSHWMVSIQDKDQTFMHTRQLEQLIGEYRDSSISFRDLIEVVKVMGNGQLYDRPSPVYKPIHEQPLSLYSEWHNMRQNMCHTVDVCTVEDAYQKLQDKASTHKTQGNLLSATVRTQSPDEPQFTECPICLLTYDFSHQATSPIVLLPCSHVCCTSCWRTHLQQSFENGANNILCMDTNCTNVMDITTASTIIPYDVVLKWQDQVRARYIDSSPDCSWCPNVACGKVAVSKQGSMKLQFGKLVMCDCKSCWCSGCLGEPHWPASCDQIAAYKQLLAKTNKEFFFGDVDVSFQVEVKKCPSCKYPIQKNEGCPSMYCTLCGHAFCWNCLRNSHTHGLCEAENIKTSKYSLANKLEMNLPLKRFPDCILLRSKIDGIKKIKPWLQRLRSGSTLQRKVSSMSSSFDVYAAVKTAEEYVFFLKQVYTFQETMHVLTDFAELNIAESKVFVGRALSKMQRLNFIVSRLEEKVLKKSLSDMCKFDDIIRYLMQAGHDVMNDLAMLAPILQNLSKNMETVWIGKLDPNNSVRYR